MNKFWRHIADNGLAYAVVIIVLACLFATVGHSEDWSKSPFFGWADKQLVTMESLQRFCPASKDNKNCTCCSGAEIVKTQFRVNKKNGMDEWWFVSPVTNTWKRIPNDIIHDEEEKTPTGQPVLFLYPIGSDNPRCFFRGDTGG